MAHVPAQPASSTPVFSDPSGRRASTLRRVSWALCAAFAALVGAVAFTLLTQVPLPGLDGLLPSGPESTSPRVTPAQADDDGGVTSGPEEPATLTTAELETRFTALARPAVRDRSTANATGETVAKGRAQTTTPATTGATPVPSPVPPATPSEHANPQATTKVRNPQAAPKKLSPTADRTDNTHAATGHGPTATTAGAATAPGRNK